MFTKARKEAQYRDSEYFLLKFSFTIKLTFFNGREHFWRLGVFIEKCLPVLRRNLPVRADSPLCSKLQKKIHLTKLLSLCTINYCQNHTKLIVDKWFLIGVVNEFSLFPHCDNVSGSFSLALRDTKGLLIIWLIVRFSLLGVRDKLRALPTFLNPLVINPPLELLVPYRAAASTVVIKFSCRIR